MTTETAFNCSERSAIPRRAVATRNAAWARALAAWLARAYVRPNSVSLASIAFAAAGATAFTVVPDFDGSSRAFTLVLAAAAIQLRLLCNLLDGLIAVEEGFRTKTGEVYNDVPDRIADMLLLTGAGTALRGVAGGTTLAWLAALLAVFTAYIRVLGGSIGLGQSFVGPMAKQHRMFALTVASLSGAIESLLGRSRWSLWLGLAIIVVGSAVTAARRLGRILAEVEAR